jgi:hypothetical protein
MPKEPAALAFEGMAPRFLALAVCAAVTSTALAQSIAPPPVAGPTSGEPSLHSGRTIGVGETLVAASAGFPGVSAELVLAPSSTFNVGVRAAFLYASPIMGTTLGFGGQVALPLRLHVFGQDTLDLAVLVVPTAVLGEGSVVGEASLSQFADDFGYALYGEAGARLGWHPDDGLTLLAGASAEIGFAHTPSFGGPDFFTTFLGTLGLEGLLARDLMLFVLAQAGGGVAANRGGLALFARRFVLRVTAGAAFLL